MKFKPTSRSPPQTVVFGSYMIAHGFFSVYNMCVDTLFLCFCECSPCSVTSHPLKKKKSLAAKGSFFHHHTLLYLVSCSQWRTWRGTTDHCRNLISCPKTSWRSWTNPTKPRKRKSEGLEDWTQRRPVAEFQVTAFHLSSFKRRVYQNWFANFALCNNFVFYNVPLHIWYQWLYTR